MEAYYEAFHDTRDELLVQYQTGQAGGYCPPHFHSCIEIMYVCEGELTATINGETEKLGRGDLYIAGSYDIHSNYTQDHSKGILLIIPEKMVKNFVEIAEGKKFGSPFLRGESKSEDIYRCIRTVYEETRDGPGNYLEIKGYLYVILGAVMQCLPLVEKPNKSQNSFPRDILMFIQDNYKNCISLEETAHRFGYSSYYFCKFFREYFGCGFKEYVNLLRVRNAAMLMTQDGSNFTAAALDSGFDSQRTFNRVFKKIYGQTPSEFKKKYKDRHLGSGAEKEKPDRVPGQRDQYLCFSGSVCGTRLCR